MKHKKLLISIIALSFSLYLSAQDEITMVVSGGGETKEEAVASALRSGIEQSFGSFVSSNTSILNDELVKDEIVSVTSGVVKSYKEVAIEKLASGSFYATLLATFSLNQMTVYAKSKGSSAELSGNVFAMNMKLKEVNKRNEVTVIENLLIQVKEMIPYVFERTIKLEDLSYVDENNLCLPMQVGLKFSDTGIQMLSLILNTLKNLAISKEELSEYEKLNIPHFKVRLFEIPFMKELLPYRQLPYKEEILDPDVLYGMKSDEYDGMGYNPYDYIEYQSHHSGLQIYYLRWDWENRSNPGLTYQFYLRNADSLEKMINISKVLSMESRNFKIISNQNDVIQCFSNAEEEDAGWYTRYLLSLENSLNSPNGAISSVAEQNPQRFDYSNTSIADADEKIEIERRSLRSVLNCHIIPEVQNFTRHNEFLLPKIKLTIKSDDISKYSSFNIERIPELDNNISEK